MAAARVVSVSAPSASRARLADGFWLATKGNVRKVQGRLNDMGMLIAVHAQRDAESGRYTPACREMLEEVARHVRVFHMLFWAGQLRPARADKGVSFSVLRTERGLEELLARDALTQQEYDLLVHNPAYAPRATRHAPARRHSGAAVQRSASPRVPLPPPAPPHRATHLPCPCPCVHVPMSRRRARRLAETQRHHAVLEWILVRFVTARRAGLLTGGVGMESRFLEEACKLRAVCASITDDAAARMPLSYVHLVQLLVDCLVALAPFALYPKLGVLTVLLSPILVIFYRGFLQLSKSFLDPFGNEDSISENFSISCLLCETNAGSRRWYSAIEGLPFSTNVPAQVAKAA